MTTVGDRIRIIRKQNGLTQKEFGERLSITTAMVCMYEHNKPRRTERTLNAICKEFGINKDWLLLGIGNMEEKQDEISLKLKKEIIGADSLKKTLEISSKHMTLEDWKNLNKFMEEMEG